MAKNKAPSKRGRNIVFTIKAKVWIYPGDAAWHFVYVGEKESAIVKRSQAGLLRRGFGAVRVTATIGTTTWKTSIFPTKEGPYLLPLKADVRKKEGVISGSRVEIRCSL